MIPLSEFREQHAHNTPLELIEMLYKLSQTIERISMVGLNKQARGRVARGERDALLGDV